MHYLNGLSTKARPTNRLMSTAVSLASVLVISACGGSTTVTQQSFSGPQYENLSEVVRTADISVVGTVTDEQFIVEDAGDNTQVDEGSILEQLVSTVEVSEYLKGQGPRQIQVIQPAGESEQSVTLAPGDNVVLWLAEENSSTAPSVYEQVGRTWSPIGLDQGVADVVGERAVPRASSLSAVSLEALGVDSD